MSDGDTEQELEMIIAFLVPWPIVYTIYLFTFTIAKSTYYVSYELNES